MTVLVGGEFVEAAQYFERGWIQVNKEPDKYERLAATQYNASLLRL